MVGALQVYTDHPDLVVSPGDPPKPYSYIVYLLYYYYYVTVKQMKQVYIEREWVYSYRGRPHQSGE